MDGFGYPMIDILNTFLCSKGKEMYENTQTLMSEENVNKEVSNKVENAEGKSEIELKESFEKKEMELENNYSDILFIYWVTMFYLSIYPVGIVQSFINLLFKFIIEKNFLMNVYKRPEFVDPKIGFFCFNFFNFGFFLFLWGNYIFFKNDYNEKSFGLIYILVMILALVLPFYLLAKLISFLTNNFCLDEKEKKFEEIEYKMISNYKILNPIYNQKEEIKNIFINLKEKNNNLLTDDQLQEIKNKIDKLNIRDLYNLEQKLRTPKTIKNMTFEERLIDSKYLYENESKKVTDNYKNQLYYYLIQLGLLDYLEEGNIFKPKKKKIVKVPGKKIESESLENLSMQENFTNSDSGYFNTFFDEKENKLILVYVNKGKNVAILDAFEKKILYSFSNLHSSSASFSPERLKIVCVSYFKIENTPYLVTIAKDNTMRVTNLNEPIKDNYVSYYSVGDNFIEEGNEDNLFSLSTVKHGETVWIITSYNYDNIFKIFNINGNFIRSESCDENIINLEALFYTNENTFICVRTTNSILLYINTFFIKIIYQNNQIEKNYNNQEKQFINYSHNNNNFINFKLIRTSYINEQIYIFISVISNDLNYYNIYVYDISNIFPFYSNISQNDNENNVNNENSDNNNMGFNERLKGGFKNFMSKIIFGKKINPDVHIGMNEGLREKIKENNPILVNYFSVILDLNEQTITKDTKNKILESKYNLGNILLWENKYIIVGTPLDYLDILDYQSKNNENRVGKINNSILSEKKNDNFPIIAYGISEAIDDPRYGKSFIMGDNKGKIQYIRPAVIQDKLNYKIIKSDEYFNELPEDEKLKHIRFSMNFYFFYCLISYTLPFCFACSGADAYDPEKQLTNEYYYNALYLYLFYSIFGIWFKGCVYNIDDETHTKRTCTKIVSVLSLISKVAGNCYLAYRYCQGNDNGLYLVFMIFVLFMTHAITNCCICMNKIKFVLKKYWLNFLFYQISRFLILLYFMICIIDNVNKIDIYIYALVLCVIMIYAHFVNYFNTLFKEITYTNKWQAIFNYPFEWMNLFCCYCYVPKEIIKEIDRQYCTCDSCVLMVIQYIIYCAIVLCILLFMIIAIFFCYALQVAGSSSNNN